MTRKGDTGDERAAAAVVQLQGSRRSDAMSQETGVPAGKSKPGKSRQWIQEETAQR